MKYQIKKGYIESPFFIYNQIRRRCKIVFLILMIILSSCSQRKKANHLINQTSPYLLQHAYNPVDWYPWNEQTLQMAREQNKMLLISIGYAACHWCHVMEKECFEDQAVAKIMNENFVNIKVDREERPDVDKVYMTALHLLTQNGGWPLNCIALPDGKPFWGATYVPKTQWINILKKISDLYKNNPQKIQQVAEQLTQGIRSTNLIQTNSQPAVFSKQTLVKSVNSFMQRIDTLMGGMDHTPKFPMPSNYHYLLRYAHTYKDKKVAKFVYLTLDKMAMGGIFDHIGGGFSRYSTDAKWHIPHFEKMLYDNAQLVSLYADAYLCNPKPLYKQTVYQTLDFIEEELTDTNGAFYCSLDADSKDNEGHLKEGAFYIWNKEELKDILKQDYDLFAKYYNINDFGHWEDDVYHLIRDKTNDAFIKEHKLSLKTLQKKINLFREKLYKQRQNRSQPRLDDKTLTSWNALMLKAYTDAYRVFEEDKFLNKALQNAKFIKNRLFAKDGGLYRNYKNNHSNTIAYLEDYATVIDAFINLYEYTLDTQWIGLANELAQYCFKHFYDKTSQMFFFTNDTDAKLISRDIEIDDNVIPASNSILARGLFTLGHYFENKKYLSTAEQMLNNMQSRIENYGLQSHSNWLQLYQDFVDGFYQVVIVGQEAPQKIKLLNQYYIPNKIIIASKIKSDEPLLKNRYKEGKTIIYVCRDGVCKLPAQDVRQALQNMR